jgi:glycosyltransferase involved in cell wall biosynthesis
MTPMADRTLKVAYVMSRFPKLTETFIVSEMLAVEDAGVSVSIYPLLREEADLVQPAAAALVARATYLPFVSWPIVRSQLRFLTRAPRRYLGTLTALVRGAWRSPRFLVGGLAIFPKVAHMAELMRAAGIDHVHCHFANHPAAAGFVIHRLVGLPYSFTAHGSDLHKDRTMLCDKIRDAAFAVTISDYNRDLIRDTCPSARTQIELVHCGVDTTRFRPAPRSQQPPFKIISVGTLHEVKGQRYLVEACAELARRGVDFRCRFVGDGPDRAMLEALARASGISERVEFTGAMTSVAVLALLHDSHVLVAPSVPTRDGRREGIPVVLMEAMATGLPVVASRLSGIPELVEDGANGILVHPGDAEDLANGLATLADAPERRDRLGESARRTIVASFDAATNGAYLAARFRQAGG